MKIIRALFATLIVLAILAGLAFGGYYAIKFSIDVVARLDYQTTVLVTASLVALLVAVIIARGIRRASRQSQANQLHAEKAATYQLFTELWSLGLRSTTGNHHPPDELLALDRLLSLYGSPRVVKAYITFRQIAQASDTLEQAGSQLAIVVRAMREDLGSDTHGLTAVELQRLLGVETSVTEANATANTYPNRKPHVVLAAKS